MVRPPRSRYRLIHMFDNRSVSCTVLCIRRYLCVRFPQKCLFTLARSDAPKSHRRRGFSSRATAAMFVTTVINLLLFTLHAVTQVVMYIWVFQLPLNLAAEYPPDIPLSEIPIPRPESVGNGIWSKILVIWWAAYIPVSINFCRCWIPYLFMLVGGMAQRSHRHLEGLGPLPRSTVGNPHTVHYVDCRPG